MALNFIVPGIELLSRQERLAENHNTTTLCRSMFNVWETVKWCARRHLIKNRMDCPGCDRPCRLIARRDIQDEKSWACYHCRGKRYSIRTGTWFSGSHLSLYQVIVITYGWSCDLPQDYVAREAMFIDSSKTMVDWANFCREACMTWLENHQEAIGGVDPESGEPLTVELDETYFFHRKYHRGRWRNGRWVFGGIERKSGKIFMIEVNNRRAATLKELTRQWVLPGSHVITDGWKAYTHLGRWFGGVYSHSVIIHEENFVDPEDREIHTQNVENLWMRAKSKLRRQFGTTRDLFPSYLQEFLWRCNCCNDKTKTFNEFLLLLNDTYQG